MRARAADPDSGDMTPTNSTSDLIAASTSASSRTLQRAGGIAALVKATTYVVGFAVMAAYLAPRGFSDTQGGPAASLSFRLDNQTAMYSWYLVLYLMGGSALVCLVLAVHDLLRRKSPALSLTASVFGNIWAGLLLASGLISLVGQRAVVDLAPPTPRRPPPPGPRSAWSRTPSAGASRSWAPRGCS